MGVVFINRFCHPDHSATSQMLSDLAAGLAAQGMSIAMVASRQLYDDPTARLPPREQWQSVQIHRLWTSRFGRGHLVGRAIDYLTFYLSLPWVLLPLVHRGDVLVTKTDPPLVSLLVALIARLRGAVLVNWLQDVFPEVAVSLGHPPVPRPLAWLLRKLRNQSLHAAAMNVTIGERMAEALIAQGVSAQRMMVIANWAQEQQIQPMPSSQSGFRQSLGLADKFVVGYSGNLGRAHDPDTIFDAVLQLRDHDAIAFLFIGGGHGYERLRMRALDAGLGNAHFRPYQSLDQLSDSLAAADVHLVSLRPELEGQIVPSKFYGIAAAERPVAFIGDPDGELGRLIAGSDCGFSVGQGPDSKLAEQILVLAADPERARAQGRRARQLLEARFSRAQAHQRWQQLLAGLIGQK